MKRADIHRLRLALKKAEKLENELSGQMGEIARIIEESTGVIGFVDHLQGDGFGFTPEINSDTHVGVDEIIKWATNGEVITEEMILNRLSF